MFSGKTEELIRRLRRVVLAKQDILLVKPSIDDRYSEDEVVSHSDYRLPATVVPTNNGWSRLARDGVRVIVAGLDLDYEGKPFLDPTLLAIAEEVTKLTAVCITCGHPATKTQRLSGGKERVEVGAKGQYEARCRLHWTGSSSD
jgi:thymidine kinase